MVLDCPMLKEWLIPGLLSQALDTSFCAESDPPLDYEINILGLNMRVISLLLVNPRISTFLRGYINIVFCL